MAPHRVSLELRSSFQPAAPDVLPSQPRATVFPPSQPGATELPPSLHEAAEFLVSKAATLELPRPTQIPKRAKAYHIIGIVGGMEARNSIFCRTSSVEIRDFFQN